MRRHSAARRSSGRDPVPPDDLPRPSTTDPRADLKPAAMREPAWPRGTWSWCRTCRSRRASSIQGAGRLGDAARAARRRAARAAAAIRTPPTADRLGLHQLGPRVQRQPRRGRQLPRLQHLQHRARQQAAADRVGGLPRRPGRRLDLRQPAVHVGRADPRPRSTAACRAWCRRSATSASAACASSTSPT